MAWALSCSVNWALVLWIRKGKIKTHSTKFSTQGLISNLHALFEVKTVADSGFMNDRIALVSHSSVLVSHLSLIRLYSSALVSHSSSLVCTRLSFVLPLVCNISNNPIQTLNFFIFFTRLDKFFKGFYTWNDVSFFLLFFLKKSDKYSHRAIYSSHNFNRFDNLKRWKVSKQSLDDILSHFFK